MTGEQYIDDITGRFRTYQQKAEKAIAQVSDEAFFVLIDANSNSIAQLVKHLAGNLRSRWRDVLTTDGEKPDRNRDREFDIRPTDTRDALMNHWREAWGMLYAGLGDLPPDNLSRTIYIRKEPHTLYEAIHRSLTHVAEHIGQIVLLAKHLAGDDWETLSIARGKSTEFNRAKGQ